MTVGKPKPTTPKRAVGYVRVSSVRGREGESFLSPDLQREKIEAWASYRGYTIDCFYTDLDQSGRTMKRPEFERLMADARRGQFDAVVVYRLTRFARSVRGASNALDELLEHGVDLVSVSEDIDTTTAGGKLTRAIFLALSEFESDRIGEEWRNVHANRRGRGIAHVAKRMYGFETSHAAIDGVIEAEAEAVRLIFDLRVKGLGYGAIRRALFERGFRPTGGGTHFGLSTITQMIQNPLYAGMMRVDGELVRARHEAIVGLDLWRAVNALRRPLDARARHRTALLSGLVFCSGCGRRMKYERRSDRPAIYRCTTSKATSTRCPGGSSVTGDALERYVVDCLLLSRAKFAAQREAAAEHVQRSRARHLVRLGEIQRALDQLTSRLGSAEPLLIDEYERQMRQLVEERAAIEEVTAEFDVSSSNVIAFPNQAAWADMSLDDQRAAVAGLVRRIVVAPSATQGGRHDRGIDFEGRVRFELVFDTPASAAIGKLLYKAIDWHQGIESTDGGVNVSMRADIADALQASPWNRPTLRLGDEVDGRSRLAGKIERLKSDSS